MNCEIYFQCLLSGSSELGTVYMDVGNLWQVRYPALVG